jgi:polysaccharide biosynthesis protein PslH
MLRIGRNESLTTLHSYWQLNICSPGMRILFITSVSPYPVTAGGNQRSNLLYRALSEFADVDLALYSRDDLLEVRQKLKDDFRLVAQFPWKLAGKSFPFSFLYRMHPKLIQAVAATLLPRELDYRPDRAAALKLRALVLENGYDLVVGRYLLPTLKSGAIGYLPTVLDVDDVDSHIYRSRLRLPGLSMAERLANYWHYHQIEKLLPSRLRLFNRVWVSHDENDELNYVSRKVLLPNVPLPLESTRRVADCTEGSSSKRPILLFVGSFWHLPNEPAIDHFVQAIWPAIHRVFPKAIFRIVGSNMSEAMKARWLAVPGVKPVGFVSDLTTSYSECSFAVVPLLSCTGTNIKVLEALSFGRTCVVTKIVHAGFASLLKSGESLLVADNDNAFSEACIQLLANPQRCNRLAASGRQIVSRHYSFHHFKAVVRSTVLECKEESPLVQPL